MNHELKVDKRVLKVVERGLGLKVPTRIRHVALLTGENPLSEVMASLTGGFAAGAQYMRTMNGKHQIEVKTRLSRYDADVALNHELRHAHQLEKLGGNEAFRHAYDMASRRACWQNGCGCLRIDCEVGYWRNTYEMEARFYEAFLRVFGGIPPIHQRPSRGIIGRLTSNG